MLSDAQRSALSARLRQRPATPVTATVRTGGVRLNDGSADRKLVLFHAIGGTVYAYGHLARELAEDFQVWGIPAPEKDGDASDTSLTSLIQYHLRVLRRLQPIGPYRLAGWSMGGILAYEIARILLSQGERVIAVGLLDSPYWLPAELTDDDAEFAGWFVSDAARSFAAALGEPPDPATTGVVEQLDWLADRLGGDAELRAALDRRFQAFRDNTEMLAGYRPSGPLASDTLIIDVEESPNMSRLWQGATQGRATLLSMAGTHYSFLQPPGVAELAAAVRAAFRSDQHDTDTGAEGIL